MLHWPATAEESNKSYTLTLSLCHSFGLPSEEKSHLGWVCVCKSIIKVTENPERVIQTNPPNPIQSIDWSKLRAPLRIKSKFHLLRHVTTRYLAHAFWYRRTRTCCVASAVLHARHVTTRTTRRACRVVRQQVECGFNKAQISIL